MTSTTQSQPPIPRQPIGATFVVAISVLGAVLVAQFIAIAWFFLPKLQQQVVDSATVARVQPATEPPPVSLSPGPSAVKNAPAERPGPDPAMVQKINALVADADKSYRLGDSDAALCNLEQAEELLPGDPGILLRKARALESVQQTQKAISVYAQVVALPGLAPELRAQAARKLEQLRADAPASAAPVNAGAVDETGPDVRDEIGLQPGATLGIVDTRLRDGSPGTKVLRVATKGRPNAKIDTRLVKLHVFFYEQDDGGDIQLTESKVVSQWISPPIDWADNEPELLDVTYILPDSSLPGSAASNGSPGRKFAGYIVGVYYNGELQDTRADPGSLAKRFPLPLYLKQQDAQ